MTLTFHPLRGKVPGKAVWSGCTLDVRPDTMMMDVRPDTGGMCVM